MAAKEGHCCTKRRSSTKIPNWSELQPELLELILRKLPNFVDILRFKAVSPCWNYTAKSFFSTAHGTSLLQAPWLFLPTEQLDDEDIRCFYNPADKKVYTSKDLFKDFDRNDWFIGSSHGWLVIWNKNTILSLLNPISGNIIELASTSTVESLKFCNESIVKALISADPSHNNNFFIVVMYRLGFSFEEHGLAFCKHGDSTWNHLGYQRHGYRDIVFHNNHLFACSYFEMEVWDFGDAYPIKTMDFQTSNEALSFSGGSGVSFHQHCLVESLGELLYVKKLTITRRVESLHFYVYKLNFTSKKWEKVECLHDRALCLGDKQSAMSISTRDFPEFEENSIYSASGFELPDDYCEVYNLEKKAFKSYYKSRVNRKILYYKRKIFRPPVFWIVPNPAIDKA